MRCVVARSLLLVIVTTAGMSALLRGQAPDQNRPAFEVASVKDNTSRSRQSAMQWTLPDGPDWLQSARNLKPTTFDCSAILQSRLKRDPMPSVRPGTSEPVCGATAGPR